MKGKGKPKKMIAVTVTVGKKMPDPYMNMLAKTMGKNRGAAKKK